jgi:cytochrome c-type biogenesis protein CcmH
MPQAQAATSPDEILADPVLEQRARGLAKQLRCLVCQNQSIDDSDAELAGDLRRLVRERLLDGDSDAEIIAFLTARYGDFVLLEPPLKPATWGLWFGPAVVLVLAAGGAAVYLRRRRAAPTTAPAPLDPAEQARLDAIIEDGPSSG